jgi:hypothetical protein
MSDLKHPSELNAFQQYRRSVKVAKTTSRMKNLAWYQSPLELDVQIHCYIKDGSGASCYLRVQSSDVFEQIGGLSSRQLEQRDQLEKFIDSALQHEACRKAKSLGVIFYIADEFSLAGLGPEYRNPGELHDLRDKMRHDPKEVLDDKTISTDTHAWRLFPYAGAAAGGEFATVVAVSRRRSETLKALREIGDEKNFPIKTSALSAPLCAVGLVPWFANASEDGGVCLFNYHTFTLMAFFNSHGNLMVLRYMPHANGAVIPANIGPAIQSTATAFEMEKPDIFLVSMVGNDLVSFSSLLQQSMLGASVLTVDPDKLLHAHGLPAGCPLECIAITQDIDTEVYPLAENETFSALRNEAWYIQDFLSAEQDEIDMYPDRADMKILKFGRRIKKIAAVLFMGILLYGGYNISTKVKSDVWSHQQKDDKAETSGLTNELKRYEHWDNLLMDRSKAWVCLELVAHMIPADGSVMLKTVKHTVQTKKDGKNSQSGFTKDWLITGFASELGIEHLEKHCTSDGINKLFQDVALSTENAAYLPSAGHRDITVSLAPRFNPSYNKFNTQNVGNGFERVFTLNISQNVTSDDEMALAAVEGANN